MSRTTESGKSVMEFPGSDRMMRRTGKSVVCLRLRSFFVGLPRPDDLPLDLDSDDTESEYDKLGRGASPRELG